MPVAKYVVKRSLVSPLTAGTEIVWVIPCSYAGIARSRTAIVTRHRALSGARAAYYQSADVAWDLSTVPLYWTASPNTNYFTGARHVVMFLDSMESGEVFQFDPDADYTTAGGSIVYRNCVLDADAYQEPRRAELDSLYQYSFRIVTAGSTYP